MTNNQMSNLNELFNLLEELNKKYAFDTESSPFIYRGMNNFKYTLLPTVLRTDTYFNKNDNLTPITIARYLNGSSECEILKSFIKEAACYIQNISTTDYLGWAEYAQHFGAPTRLLDWTTNPLVALFFACTGSNESENADASLWILHRNNYYRFIQKHSEYLKCHAGEWPTIKEIYNAIIKKCDSNTIEYPLIYTPYYVDQRMSAQSSIFMIWGSRCEPLESLLQSDNRLSPSEPKDGIYTYGAKEENEILLKVTIPYSVKMPFLKQLDLIGINEKALFHSLEGVGKYIERKYRSHFLRFVD